MAIGGSGRQPCPDCQLRARTEFVVEQRSGRHGRLEGAGCDGSGSRRSASIGRHIVLYQPSFSEAVRTSPSTERCIPPCSASAEPLCPRALTLVQQAVWTWLDSSRPSETVAMYTLVFTCICLIRSITALVRLQKFAPQFTSWEMLMTLRSIKMKGLKIPTEQRKHIRSWVEKYKQGWTPHLPAKRVTP